MANRKPNIRKSYTDDKAQLSAVSSELYELFTGSLSFDGNLPSKIFRTSVRSNEPVKFPEFRPYRFVGAQLIWSASPVKKFYHTGETMVIEFEGSGNIDCRFLVIYD